MNIAQLIEELGHVKTIANQYYKEYKELQLKEQAFKSELMVRLQEAGLTSAKGSKFQASITAKPDVQIMHEHSVLEWLNESPDVEADAYIGLKKTEFKGLALQILKETGEVIPGTEVNTIESLTVRKNKVKE